MRIRILIGIFSALALLSPNCFALDADAGANQGWQFTDLQPYGKIDEVSFIRIAKNSELNRVQIRRCSIRKLSDPRNPSVEPKQYCNNRFIGGREFTFQEMSNTIGSIQSVQDRMTSEDKGKDTACIISFLIGASIGSEFVGPLAVVPGAVACFGARLLYPKQKLTDLQRKPKQNDVLLYALLGEKKFSKFYSDELIRILEVHLPK